MLPFDGARTCEPKEMTVEKLRPEQRKLWRKTYHQERDRCTAPKIAAERADDAVKEWEARGAFDEETDAASEQRPTIAAHSHAHMRAIASSEHCAVFPGDELRFGAHGKAVVVWPSRPEPGCVTFDVIVRDGILLPGDKATFCSPRPGIATEAVAITG